MIGLKISGLKISLGDNAEQLQELRNKMKQNGAPEMLSDNEWLNRKSIIPQRTMRNIGNIPPSAGFVRNAKSVRRPVAKKQPIKPPFKFTVEEDKLIDEEFQKIPELTAVFIDCLAEFPELVNKEIQCRATHSNNLAAVKGTLKGKPFVILFVPQQA